MTIKDAVVARFDDLLKEKNITKNELANLAGVTPSSVYSMFDSNRRDISIITIKKLCDGLDLGLDEFFDADIFRTLDQHIQ